MSDFVDIQEDQKKDQRIAALKAENERLRQRESDLEYIAGKWCKHECVASDCAGCPMED